MNISSSIQKPSLLTTIGVMTLISGITNVTWGVVWTLGAIGSFFGVICLPLSVLPIILGVFEIVYSAKLLSTQPQPAQASPTLAAFQIAACLYGNIFSMVVGILNLIFFNDLVVKEYFSSVNQVPGVPAAKLPETSTPLALPKDSE
jgi:hypothetical protein